MLNISGITGSGTHQTAFHYVGIGMAAANLKLNDVFLNFVLIESNTFMDGEIHDFIQDYESQGTSCNGKNYISKAKVGSTIRCQWLGSQDSNRVTPPNIRRGGRAAIYRLGDTQIYFWSASIDGVQNRRGEAVVYAYSATMKEDVVLNDSNSYTQGVDTFNKTVNLIKTSKANDEPFAYDINVDAKTGKVTIKDDVGNIIYLESKSETIEIKNVSGSNVKMVKDVIDIQSNNIINIKSNTINIEASNINSKATWNHTGNFTATAIKAMSSLFVGLLNVGKHRHRGYRGSTTDTPKN